MLYNKNNVRKTNDKKILHKVGKQWKVVSVALLMAIGGGAVATHAVNAQSNNNGADAAEIAYLEKPAPVQSASTSAQPSSSAAKSASASAKPSSAVSYLSGNNGSAAKYNARAVNDNSVINNYVSSLNAKFPTAVSMASTMTSSAQSAENFDKSMASSYSAVANSSDTKSAVSSLASKAGFTPADYANVVSWSANNNSNAVKSAQDFENAFNMVSSLANDVEGNNWNSASVVASSKAASLAADSTIANAKLFGTTMSNSNGHQVPVSYAYADSALNTAKSSSAQNAMDYTNNVSSSVAASVATKVAQNNASSAVSDINTVAKYLNINPAVVNSAVNSASSVAAVNSAYNISGAPALSDGTNTSNSVSQGTAFSAMNFAVSNSSAMSSAASVTASANAKIASAKAKSAVYSAAVSSASVASVKANSELNELSDAQLVASVANAATSTMANSLTSSNSAAFMSNLMSAAKNGKSAVASVLGVNSLPNFNSDEKLMLGSMASAEGVNALALKNNENAIKSVASVASSAMNGKAFNLSNVSSVASAISSSASTETSSAESVSNAYAQSNDTDVVLAGSFASSYANDASSEANLVSSAAAGLAYFGAQNGLNTSAYNSAVADEPNASGLAKAFGLNVWNNNVPKTIFVTHNGYLHSAPVYAHSTNLTGVHAGQQLAVKGVGFDADGTVRYYVTVNGKSGFFSANYAKPAYLFAVKDNNGSVKLLKNTRVYKDVNRTQYANMTLHAGEVVNDVTVVNLDKSNELGGYTEVETKSGNFFTANTKYVESYNGSANNNNSSAANNNAKPAQILFF